jgi:hypothetical protein
MIGAVRLLKLYLIDALTLGAVHAEPTCSATSNRALVSFMSRQRRHSYLTTHAQFFSGLGLGANDLAGHKPLRWRSLYVYILCIANLPRSWLVLVLFRSRSCYYDGFQSDGTRILHDFIQQLQLPCQQYIMSQPFLGSVPNGSCATIHLPGVTIEADPKTRHRRLSRRGP